MLDFLSKTLFLYRNHLFPCIKQWFSIEIIGLFKQTFDFQLKSLDYLSKCWISYVNHIFCMKIITGKLWEALGGSGKLWEALRSFGKLWEDWLLGAA